MQGLFGWSGWLVSCADWGCGCRVGEGGSKVLVAEEGVARVAVTGEPAGPIIVSAQHCSACRGDAAGGTAKTCVGEESQRSDGKPAAASLEPACDRVGGRPVVGWLGRLVGAVVGLAGAAADLCGEIPLLVRTAGDDLAPLGRGENCGDVDGFGVNGGEEPGWTERGCFCSGRDEDAGAAFPCPASIVGVSGYPGAAAEDEPGEQRAVGGQPAVTLDQSLVTMLGADEVWGRSSRIGPRCSMSGGPIQRRWRVQT